MLHRLKCGNTTENNQWRLPEGVVTWDREAKQLRLHNGQLPGGFAINTEQAYLPPPAPGPQQLIAGDNQYGYYGRLTDGDLVTPTQFQMLMGFNTGRMIPSTGEWFKFSSKEKTVFIPRKPFFSEVTAEFIDSLGARYGQAAITIGANSYRVRLMAGADKDPSSLATNTYNSPAIKDSEFASLFGSLLTKKLNPFSREWAAYHTSDLSTSYEFCQEGNVGPNTTTKYITMNLYNQYNGVRYGYTSITGSRNDFNWRPVLELIA